MEDLKESCIDIGFVAARYVRIDFAHFNKVIADSNIAFLRHVEIKDVYDWFKLTITLQHLLYGFLWIILLQECEV